MEEKKFVNVGSLKVGGYVLIDGAVCQVKSSEKSKPGKHGAAKARITAFDIFSGQKMNLLKQVNADAEVPIIKKGTAQVVAVLGDNLQLMDVESYTMKEVTKPKDITGIQQGMEVETISFGDKIKITRKKQS